MRRFWPLLLLAGCVTVEDTSRISAMAIRPQQRTIVVVYPSPGPWVIPDPESKAESAAKTLPVFAGVVQAYQDDRGLKEAQALRQYVPRYNPAKAFSEALMAALAGSGYSGTFVPQSGSDLTDEQVRRFNRSADVLTWQQSYFYPSPEIGTTRNYASILSLDDALILEVNLMHGVSGTAEGNMTPTLWASTRLLRANTLKPIWRKEDSVDDPEAARSMYEFMTLPKQLTDRWDALVPQLASRVSGSLQAALQAPAPPVATQ